ncbi:MAG: NFACT family protein [Methanobrevibacter sp.]|jgi:predicted ribosome quality control (RQC) complex YloA/Tae2 family protein|nr:NFACT family protein [Candidatus Methanovirga australis]
MKIMTNVDIFAVTHELNEFLEGARVDKSFQPRNDIVLMRFHKTGVGRIDVVFQSGVRAHKTDYPLNNPMIPPSFTMLLRKKLKGAHVIAIKQHNFDRVIKLEVQKEQKYTLVIELFSKGNIILLDEENNIIMPLKRKLWSDRDISSKKEYKYPSITGINPIDLSLENLTQLFKESDSDLIRTLARNGLGGTYSEEIVLRTGLDKGIQVTKLTDEEIAIVYEKIKKLFNPLIKLDFKPNIILEKENDNVSMFSDDSNTESLIDNQKDENSLKRLDVLPLELDIHKNHEKEYFNSFNEAADEFYSEKIQKEIKSFEENVWDKKVNKFSNRLKKQEESLSEFEKTTELSKKKGEILYSNYTQIEDLLKVINDAEKKYSRKEISKILKKAKKDGMVEAQIFESMDTLGTLVLDIEDVKIAIDYRKSLAENAEVYYEKGKKAKRKIKGGLVAVEDTKKQLKDMETKRERGIEKIELPKRRVKKPLLWFEKLRWFLSSDNHLVIGGRDANTNEIVVKKYLESNDIYLHGDMHGAPSTVIKEEDVEINDETLKESAIFAASFSSAWGNGYGSADVFWVNPDQVSKTPEPGEYLTKGAFIIRGKRNYLRGLNLKIAIGIVDYNGKRIMAGPVESLKVHSDNYVLLRPGYVKKEAIAKKILHKINEDDLLSLDDIVRVLPSGKCEIIKE